MSAGWNKAFLIFMGQNPQNEPWWKPGVQIFSQVSVWVVVPIVVALIAGKWLDTRYGTRPWIFLGLSGIGFLISTFGIVYTIGEYMRQIAKEAKEKNDKSIKSK